MNPAKPTVKAARGRLRQWRYETSNSSGAVYSFMLGRRIAVRAGVWGR